MATQIRDVARYGAIGDNSTNNAVALQAAYDACNDGDTLYAKPGVYRFGTALNWTGTKAVHLYMPSVTFRPTITSGTAITYGGVSGSYVSYVNAVGPTIFRTGSYATTALILQNMQHAELSFDRIVSFQTGIVWNGLAAGCQHNRLRVRQFSYCVNSLVGANSGGGWTNELHHYGISWGHSNADIDSSAAPVICITVPASANGWSFSGCSFENASYTETDLYALSCAASAGWVTLNNCRFESDGNPFIFEVSATSPTPVVLVNCSGTAESDYTFGTVAANKKRRIPGVGWSIAATATPTTMYQPAPAAIADGDTAISAANLQSQILTMASSSAGRAPTVPTGTAVDGILSIDESIDWTFINTGNQTVTITAATGHTLVGGMALAAGTQGLFRTRCTAANTAITYRLA